MSPTALSHQSCNDTCSLWGFHSGALFSVSLAFSSYSLSLSPSLSTQRSSRPILLVKVYSIVANLCLWVTMSSGPFLLNMVCPSTLCFEFVGVGILSRGLSVWYWTVGMDTIRCTFLGIWIKGIRCLAFHLIGWEKCLHPQHWPSRGRLFL